MIKNVIIQAGGKGERAGRYSRNKPKCLLSVNNKPLLFNLIDLYPDSKIYLILTKDSKNYKTIEKFLNLHAEYKSKITIILSDYLGNAASLKQVLELCGNEASLLTWSDIYYELPDKFDKNSNIVFLSKNIQCRWKTNPDTNKISRDDGFGIFGVFYFKNSKEISKIVNNDGSIMNLLNNEQFKFKCDFVLQEKEFGTEQSITEYYEQAVPYRSYNKIIFSENKVFKQSEMINLIKRESNWYNQIKILNFKNIPKKYDSGDNDLLILEKINASNIYSYLSSNPEKSEIIANTILDTLKKLHNLSIVSFDEQKQFKLKSDVYWNETVKRIDQIKNINELFLLDNYVINGLECVNYISPKNLKILENHISELIKTKENFVSIHGDPILSNMLWFNNDVYLIDPRGYFSEEGIYGTKLYDYSKLYFSSVTNFDTFNKKLFDLEENKNGFDVFIDPKSYTQIFKKAFENNFTREEMEKIKLLAGTMWLRFASCVLDDYDSIVAAINQGNFVLNTVIKK